MDIRKTISMALASALLLTLVSCGEKDNKSHVSKQANPICEDVNCLSSVNWKIILNGKVFPDKSRVDINGTTVLNECVSKQKFMIDRDSVPQTLSLDNYIVPKRGDVKIHVIDLGHCDSESTFIKDDNVNFDLVKGGETNEVVIHL
ncbi:hypothetical protein [Peredibacter starrii]|uniref:Lipoprotein n=1 Tax=Peredibacter starrii TaxID=28202 RepID=A0AAX4HJV6_9BACT|nr:hypothetical protein [Peredibacter starrii]WPU63480.1 hypothetical protein SOO65_12350 [Peredibacter starrii]